MVADLAVTPDVPESAGELKEFVEKNPGKVTYPALPDFTGSAFVRNIIYEICGYEQFMDMSYPLNFFSLFSHQLQYFFGNFYI